MMRFSRWDREKSLRGKSKKIEIRWNLISRRSNIIRKSMRRPCRNIVPTVKAGSVKKIIEARAMGKTILDRWLWAILNEKEWRSIIVWIGVISLKRRYASIRRKSRRSINLKYRRKAGLYCLKASHFQHMAWQVRCKGFKVWNICKKPKKWKI